ncbi:hypothetical protein K461DRAFT_224228 [Myriangium duriaei CBS 260.36]|uniref:K Homology domain-containing protein n=1 Tax=Myriangium duriaei CBS 260.36 TaxID=1168546 RepID=A0A9P4J6M9_9PEZI|nr:hypothetical protein K461DRAFT_224228 [Myriangium duriaei CBS 260.36]
MAGQPDINAILAALAAQNRVGGTPSQSTPAPPPALPPGFPGAVPQQGGTPSLGGFALPQPTSSGSVDLSSVRPVSTGSVSIAEAIAKARSIAADKNIAGGRDDPRLSGRSYRHSRSRSRSPPRRDAFRDNYNPYRDERRSDDRRGGYNRDRSRSPARGQPSFSPRGGDDKDSETITVKSALVGLIIGRAGENLRRVEAETGARVQFVPVREPGTQRQCTITGTLRQREAAKREIFQTIEENGGGGGAAFDTRGSSARGSQQPPGRSAMPSHSGVPQEGETQRQVLVPDKTVGLIIGRGGETIRDIQDRSGCHINIVGENKSIGGRRPVNLIGSKEAADKAEALIWEIVDSDTRDGQGQGQGQGQGASNGRRPQEAPAYGQQPSRGYDDDKITESIFVPSEAVGMIIGKGGESIKEMQNQTGCKINVNQPGNPDIERKIDLVGSRTAVEAAKRVVWDKVDTVQQRDRASGRATGRDRDSYSQQPQQQQQQQQQQPSYGQQPQGAPQMPVPGAAGSDPNAPDPYAQYGGYQNYMALWWAAMQQQQQAGGQAPQGQ